MKNGPYNWSPSYLIETPPPPRRGPFEWWFRLTAPAEPPASASLRQRETVRRGRLISTLLALMLLLIVVVLPIALFSGNTVFLGVLAISVVTDGIALWFNRTSRVRSAGYIVVTVTTLGFIATQAFTPGGLRIGDLPDFDILVASELLAVSMLPARSVFVVALINSVFIWADVTYQPHAFDLAHFLVTDGYAAFGRPIAIQVLVATFSYLMVRSATQAIARADRAQVIATLEHAMAEQEHAAAQKKRELEMGIQQILQTHMQVANGNYDARASVSRDNQLWNLASSLNTLLSRFQQALEDSQQYERIQMASMIFIEALRRMKTTQQPQKVPKSGTIIDAIVREFAVSPVPTQESPGQEVRATEKQPT